MLAKNTVLIGTIVGAAVPFVSYAIILSLNDYIVNHNLLDTGEIFFAGFSQKFMALLGICFNLIPFQISKSRRYDNTLRGITFPTLIYVIAWIIYFNVLGIF